MHRIAICCFLFIAYASPATPHPLGAGGAETVALPAGSYSLSGLVALTAAKAARADPHDGAVRFGAFILPLARRDAGERPLTCRPPERLERPSLGRLLSV